MLGDKRVLPPTVVVEGGVVVVLTEFEIICFTAVEVFSTCTVGIKYYNSTYLRTSTIST
jgi:hypothetical protein